MKPETYLTTIPFDGFYCSDHDEMIDSALEQLLSDDSGSPYDNLVEKFWETNDLDWKNVHNQYSIAYVESLADVYGLELKFDELISPKEYNFETDRIFATISRKSLATIIKETGREEIQKVATERFTSRSGFSSFYSPNIKDWPKKFSDWDHNQIGTILEASMGSVDQLNAVEDFNCNGNIDEWIWQSAGPKSTQVLNVASILRHRSYRTH